MARAIWPYLQPIAAELQNGGRTEGTRLSLVP
jgi:hypothetical protein